MYSWSSQDCTYTSFPGRRAVTVSILNASYLGILKRWTENWKTFLCRLLISGNKRHKVRLLDVGKNDADGEVETERERRQRERERIWGRYRRGNGDWTREGGESERELEELPRLLKTFSWSLTAHEAAPQLLLKNSLWSMVNFNPSWAQVSPLVLGPIRVILVIYGWLRLDILRLDIRYIWYSSYRR